MDKLIRPPFCYTGAKTRLLDWIYSFFPEHTTFVDVFGGTGVVTFNKVPSKNDIYNDINGRIVNFYSVLRDECKRQFLACLIELTPYSRKEFNDCKQPSEDPIEDARRFYVKQNQSFSGCGHSFGSVRSGKNTKITKFHNTDWSDLVKRIQNITFENSSFEKVFELYDSKDTLFYCDPPYLDTYGTDEYKTKFGTEEQNKLIDVMKNAKGYVILSSYQHESLNVLLDNGWKLETKDFNCVYKNSEEGEGIERKRYECLYLSPRVIEKQNRLF